MAIRPLIRAARENQMGFPGHSTPNWGKPETIVRLRCDLEGDNLR